LIFELILGIPFNLSEKRFWEGNEVEIVHEPTERLKVIFNYGSPSDHRRIFEVDLVYFWHVGDDGVRVRVNIGK